MNYESQNDANMLLSVRFACAAGSQRKSLRALWLIVGSKLTDNDSRLLAVQPWTIVMSKAVLR